MLVYVLFIIGFGLLIKGADWLVDGASSFAKKLKIPAIVIGLTIVAFGTSMPELIVNIFASAKGQVDLAFGNVIGSNISNILLILGISAIIYPLGFGFDGFIHRATEVWIQNNGFITPKQPYYIGQYVLVIFLNKLSLVPLSWIDRLLLPALEAAFIPPLAFLTLSTTTPASVPASSAAPPSPPMPSPRAPRRTGAWRWISCARRAPS